MISEPGRIHQLLSFHQKRYSDSLLISELYFEYYIIGILIYQVICVSSSMTSTVKQLQGLYLFLANS